MVVGSKVCELTDGFLWFVFGLYVGILTSSLKAKVYKIEGRHKSNIIPYFKYLHKNETSFYQIIQFSNV